MTSIWEKVRRARDHTGTTFEEHLTGTAEILHEWGQRISVVQAGRYHAVYGNPHGRDAICSADSSELADEIGEEAEKLVRLWAVVDRNSLPRSASAFKAGHDPILLISHTKEKVTVSRQQYIDLAHIQVANEIEIAKRHNGVARMLKKLRPVLCSSAASNLDQCPYLSLWETFKRSIPRKRIKRIIGRVFLKAEKISNISR